MADPLRYYAQFQSARGGWGTLPPWARSVVMVFALPGLVLLALSFLAVCVSILGLLLLTVPVYRALRALTGSRTNAASVSPVISPAFSTWFGGMPGVDPSPGRKQVNVRVVDDEPTEQPTD